MTHSRRLPRGTAPLDLRRTAGLGDFAGTLTRVASR